MAIFCDPKIKTQILNKELELLKCNSEKYKLFINYTQGSFMIK